MNTAAAQSAMATNVRLYPWFRFLKSLTFWQAVWFLFFQQELSAAEAILLYAIYDVGTTVLEVPSGYMSDRIGRRFTLIVSAVAGFAGTALLALGDGFAAFAAAQVLLGASMALASGTDSALLYESLAAEGQENRIEAEELRAWRFSFVALALSAVIGGILAFQATVLPFAMSAVTMAGAVIIAARFAEPQHTAHPLPQGAEIVRLGSLGSALRHPTLIWLFVLSVLMYGFSHIPFVFGQPFILEALSQLGLAAQTPVVSGAVSGLMMVVSVLASLIAPGLRDRLGLAGILILAFGMQIALVGVLAASNSAVVIAFLLLRMVPDSLSRPFVLARIQPMLSDDSRATYMSLQSFAGRLLFAATLYLASGAAAQRGQMAYAEIQQVLVWYVAVGVVCLAGLVLAARRVKVEFRANPGGAAGRKDG